MPCDTIMEVKSFQEEYRAFFKAYEIEFGERLCGVEGSRGLSGRRAAGAC